MFPVSKRDDDRHRNLDRLSEIVGYNPPGSVLSIEPMIDPFTLAWLLTVPTIIAAGAVTKVGENITDAVGNLLKRKLPNSKIVKSLEAGEPIDYAQGYSELKPISQDPEAIELVAAIKLEIENNPELAAQVTAELDRNSAQLSRVIENWQGINIQGGNITFVLNSTGKEPPKTTTPHNLPAYN